MSHKGLIDLGRWLGPAFTWLAVSPYSAPLASARSDSVVWSNKAVVVSGHPAATEAGLRIMERGGSAMDAAVAVSLCLGVGEPYGSGLGGKLVLLYYDAESGEVSCVEALGVSPLSPYVMRYTDLKKSERHYGFRSVCVPSLLSGLFAAHKKWGSRPWPDLVEPAIRLASDGFEVSTLTAEHYQRAERRLKQDVEAARLYLPDGRAPKAGTLLKNPDLAESLMLIQKGGAQAFYKGAIAKRIVAASESAGGYLSMEDFAEYVPRLRKPLSAPYKGVEVFSSPPPLTGGAVMLLTLKALEHLDWTNERPHGPHHMDRVCRAFRAVYEQAYPHIDDGPDGEERIRKLMTPEFYRRMEKAAERIGLQSEAQPTFEPSGAASTTHFVIMDSSGNIISATQSLGTRFDACAIAPGTGFLLNNSMKNFAIRDRSSLSLLQPGKRPRSAMTPTIVLRNGRPLLAIGAPGGQRIPTTVLQVVMGVIDFDLTLDDALQLPRFHLRRPMSSSETSNLIDVERSEEVHIEALKNLGWKVRTRPWGGSYFGHVNALRIMAGGEVRGVADPRAMNSAVPKRSAPIKEETKPRSAMVAAAHPLAAEAGLRILKSGGNAMDAIISTAFALGVVEPQASGIGGGGFLVYYDAQLDETAVIDYREIAPSALTANHFTRNGAPSKKKMKYGGMAIGVPGMVRGLATAHQQFGKLSFSKLLEPAVRLAENGFTVSEQMSAILSDKMDILSENEAAAAIFLEEGIFPLEQGTLLKQPDLAGTLRAIQQKGPNAIYGEAPAAWIGEAVRAAGGIMTVEDITAYQPRLREAIQGAYRGYDLMSIGPPSLGGIAVIQILNLLEPYPLEKLGPGSPDYLSLLIAAMEVACEACKRAIADPALTDVPVKKLLSREWADEARARLPFTPEEIDERKQDKKPKEKTVAYLPDVKTPIGNTTHISVVDQMGNMAALTQTINYFFGAGVMVPGMGILLNNEMYDFTFQVGSVNLPAAGKIPRSSISPFIIKKEGKAVATLGTPGGSRIPAALAQVLIQKIDFGLSMDEAIEAPRVFYDSKRKRVTYERRIPRGTMEEAVRRLDDTRQYRLVEKGEFDKYFGGAQGIWIETDDQTGRQWLAGGTDSRRDGVALGY